MISRSFDSRAFNACLNHPAVLPWVTIPGIDVLDLSPVVADKRNHLLKATDGFFLATYEAPGVLEVHTQFFPWAKTKQTVADAFEAARYGLSVCNELITRVPQNNRAADWLARRVGFKHWFTNKAVWPTANGLVDLTFYRLQKCPQSFL